MISFEETIASSATRRTIVKTGIKLAYAAPLVAATMKLNASGAFAAVSGVAGIQVCRDPYDTNLLGQQVLTPNQAYQVTHNGTGVSATFVTDYTGLIYAFLFNGQGNPSQNNFAFSDIGSGIEVYFYSFLPSNPSGNYQEVAGCFTFTTI